MATYPSVIRDITTGLIGNLQPGDNVGVVSETGQFSRIAAATLVAGNPVYASTSTQVTKGQGNALATSKIAGLAIVGITSAASGLIQANGVVVLTTTQWDAVTGQTGGLTTGATYFLSLTTAGSITTSVPNTTGQYSVILGRAISTTDFELDIDLPFQM